MTKPKPPHEKRHRRGKISNDEAAYIMEHADGKNLKQVAAHLNRTEGAIENFCLKNGIKFHGVTQEHFDNAVLREKLATRTYWPEIQKQFSDEEIEYFVNTWIHMMKQFREDIMYSEELQVKQWITLEIMANQILANRRESAQQIVRLNERLQKQYAVDEDDRDVNTIVLLEQEIASIRNSQSSYTTEHAKILDKIKDIQKELKAARTDRIKKIDDAKTNWTAMLKSLEEEEYRQQVGEEIVLGKMAKDKAKEKLSQYHTYGDGKIDRPLLNAETIEDD